MSQTRRSLGTSLKDNPFIKRDPRWTPTPKLEEENPMERAGQEVQQSPTPKPRGRSFTPKAQLDSAASGHKQEEKVADKVDTAESQEEARQEAPVPASEPAQASVNGIQETAVDPLPPAVETADAPPPDVSSTDAFAQPGAAPDVFAYEIVSIGDSMRVRDEDDLFGDDFTPLPQPVVEEPVPAPVQQSQPQQSQSRGDGQQRGRGRGRGGRARGGVQYVSAEQQQPRQQQPNGMLQSRHAPQPSAAPDDAPQGPRKESIPSVRGDRRATGGNLKPKLTEAELEEKMARIQIKNASLTAAHARAEADAASFAERESVAAKQAKERAKEKAKASAQMTAQERKERQQMMGERERNRQRKLKGMGGREWDAEKEEGDFGKGGRFDGKGFGGDQEGCSDGREYLYREPRTSERGGKGGRGGGREKQERPPRQEDFPALPAAAPKTGTAAPVTLDNGVGQNVAGKSWADQVESSVPAS